GLWIYGDTGIFQKQGGAWKQTRFIPGSTAMLVKTVRGQVPKGGELPNGTPAHFVPDPKNLYMPDGSGRACKYPTAAFATRWPTAAALMPNKKQVLITYGSVCVTKPSKDSVNISPQAWGFLLYNWRTKKIDKGPIDVIKSTKKGSSISADRVWG